MTKQTYKNFELVVIDQNTDDRIAKLTSQYGTILPEVQVYKARPGLSNARNVGLTNILGDIVAFPDDDCIYPPTLLENVVELFKNTDNSFLLGKTIDRNGNIVAGKVIEHDINIKKSHFAGSSTTLFVHRNRIDKNQLYFDTDFGLGARYHAEEENDLIVRLLASGAKGFYFPAKIFVFHPSKAKTAERSKKNGIGLGAFIAKHIFTIYGIKYFLKYNLVRPPLGVVFCILKRDFVSARLYGIRFLGIWIGFIEYILYNKKIRK
jgi:glycosyltransferase involved in cell wall biosynthesis